ERDRTEGRGQGPRRERDLSSGGAQADVSPKYAQGQAPSRRSEASSPHLNDDDWALPKLASGGAAQAVTTQVEEDERLYGYDDDSPPIIPPLRLLQKPPAQAPDPDGDDVFNELDESSPMAGTVVNTAGIKFQEAGKIYEFDAGELALERGDQVVVDSE